MSEVVHVGQNSIARAKSEDGKFYVHTVFNDDKVVELNKKLKNEDLLHRSQLGIHDNADVRFWIQCPDTEQWLIFQKKNPDIYKALMKGDESQRVRAAKQLSILHPGWVVFDRS